MKICCVGAGYVGGPAMAVIAQKAPDLQVTVVDQDEARIAAWNSDRLPVYEPGLDEIVREVRGRNLFFSSDVRLAIAEAEMVFVAVSTPAKTAGRGMGVAVDLRHVEAVARLIAEVVRTPKIIVEKSTVPVKTAELIQQVLAANRPANRPSASCQVLSNPEFLAQGNAIRDLTHPDRILIGGERSREGDLAVAALASIYARWVPRSRILTTSLWSAELTKLVTNAFLAQRVSSINVVSALCEATGADVDEVAHAVGCDARIGPAFLQASVGFGGPSLQKDILNLVYLCAHFNLPEAAAYWEQVVRVNQWQQRRFARRIVQGLFNTAADKRIAVLGFAFKKDTNDARESPAISVVCDLLAERARVAVYDPRVPPQAIHAAVLAAGEEDSRLTVAGSVLEAAEGAHALVVLTDWDEFRTLDFARIFARMLKPAFVFDGRNLLELDALRAIGFRAEGIGR